MLYSNTRPSGFVDRILLMYHGTDPKNIDSILSTGFHHSDDGMLGKGIYVSEDINKTFRYGPVTFKLAVYMGKTRKITSQGQSDRTTWQSQANSAWVPAGCGMVDSGRSENCVRHTKQIRILGICRGWNLLNSSTQARTVDRTGTTIPLDAQEQTLVEELKREYNLP